MQQPDNTIIREHLLKADLGQRMITTVEIKKIHFKSGQVGGLHLHPCPVTGYIVSGTAIMQIEGEAEMILPAGAAFYEPAGVRITQFSNHSGTEPMVFVAFYLLNGKQELIRMLDH